MKGIKDYTNTRMSWVRSGQKNLTPSGDRFHAIPATIRGGGLLCRYGDNIILISLFEGKEATVLKSKIKMNDNSISGLSGYVPMVLTGGQTE